MKRYVLLKPVMVFSLAILLAACSKKNSDPAPQNPVTPSPVITSLSINEGDYNSTVVITGTNFGSAVKDNLVFFNGKQATITSGSSTKLTVSVPKDAGSGDVTVKVSGVTATGPPFNYLGTLAINTISANSGPYSTTVKIIGTGFSPTMAHNQVSFNGKAAAISAATNTQLTVSVPLAAGTGNITVAVNNDQPLQGPLFTYEKTYVVTTLAGTNTPGIQNGVGAATLFHQPTAICTDGAGNLYIAETFNGLIRKVTPDGTVSSYAGTAVNAANNGTVTTHAFAFSQAVTVSKSGDLYVGDALVNIIEKITPAGVVTRYTGSGNMGSMDGPALTASFNGPHGMAFDALGNLYIADTFNNLIRKVDPSGNVTTFAGNKQPGHVNGNGTSASFNGPSGIVTDAAGNLFVTDGDNGRVRKITPAGDVSDWGEAAFAYPDGIAIDASGNLYVVDATGEVIKKIDTNGIVTPIAGFTNHGYQSDGIGATASFVAPVGIAIDNNGSLYITDGNEVRKIVFE